MSNDPAPIVGVNREILARIIRTAEGRLAAHERPENRLAEVPKPASFTCPVCWLTTYNRADIREGYCGNCHDWTAGR